MKWKRNQFNEYMAGCHIGPWAGFRLKVQQSISTKKWWGSINGTTVDHPTEYETPEEAQRAVEAALKADAIALVVLL